jgi:transketolase
MMLNKNIFSKTPDVAPIRKGFGEGLRDAGKEDERVIGLCADLTESTQMLLFKEQFPKRFIEVGVAEQNLATVASGLAAMGKIPFITSYAMFSPGRNWEQIRTTIAYNDRPVKIAGSHAGISVGPDGGTHQAIEDIALMRVIPNMTVISPCDAVEAKKATLAMAKTDKPTYIRLSREKTPVITQEDTPFEIGKGQIVYENDASKKGHKDVAVIATGPILYQALLAAASLDDDRIGVVVVNIHTIKPIDQKMVIKVAQEYKSVVTVEEHQVSGGLGGAVCEVLAEHEPVPVELVGIRDVFGQSGTPAELIKHYGLDADSIVEAARRAIHRKK